MPLLRLGQTMCPVSAAGLRAPRRGHASWLSLSECGKGMPGAMAQTLKPDRPAGKCAPVARPGVIPARRDRPQRSGRPRQKPAARTLPGQRLSATSVQALVALLQAASEKYQVAQKCIEDVESCNQALRAQNEELVSCNQTLRAQLASQRQGRPTRAPSSWLCSCTRR